MRDEEWVRTKEVRFNSIFPVSQMRKQDGSIVTDNPPKTLEKESGAGLRQDMERRF